MVPRTMATAPDHATVHELGRDCTVVVPSTTSRGQHAGAVATLLVDGLGIVFFLRCYDLTHVIIEDITLMLHADTRMHDRTPRTNCVPYVHEST